MFDIAQPGASLEICEATPSSPRDPSVDFIKGILIVLVVFGHSIQFIAHARAQDYWDDPLFETIYLFHMPAFIAISGYLAATKIDGATRLGAFVSRRIFPLLLAMAVWSAILAAPSLRRALLGLEAHAAAEVWNNFLTVYWFLWALLVGAGCAFASARFAAAWRWAALAAAAAVVALPLDDYPIAMIRYTAPFYLLAYIWGRSGRTIRSIRSEVAATAAAFAAIGAFFWTRETYIYNNALAYWRPQLAGEAALMLAVAGAATIAFLRAAASLHDRIGHLAASRILTALGEMTLEIYLAQTAIFRFLRWPPDFEAGYLVAAAATAAIVAGTACLVVLSHRLPGGRLLWGRLPPLPIFARND